MNFDEVRTDFEVSYKFMEPEEGGLTTAPYRGYRCDRAYEDFDQNNQVWMIWPIFVDTRGFALTKGTQVGMTGTARMVIVNENLRGKVHRPRIKVGTRGYFMEGPRRVAEAKIIRVVALIEDDL